MICPYCSTDMEPIELSGKVFCSNCGLTIQNNQTVQPPANTVTQQFQKVENVATDVPDELQFPVVPEVVEALEQNTENNPDILLPSTDVEPESASASQPQPAEPFNPITQAAEKELGVEPVPTEVEPTTPAAESRIPDIGIPSETDFETPETTGGSTPQSFVEIASPGNETDTLEASSILLDILAEEPAVEPRKLKVEKPDILEGLPQNPIGHPELEPEDEVAGELPETPMDPKTEKKIEKLEEKIDKMSEPEVEIPTSDIDDYDPDTLKSQAIKEYFSSALSEVRNKPAKPTVGQKTIKPKKKLKEHGPALIFAITLASVTVILLVAITYYLITTFVGM